MLPFAVERAALMGLWCEGKGSSICPRLLLAAASAVRDPALRAAPCRFSCRPRRLPGHGLPLGLQLCHRPALPVRRLRVWRAGSVPLLRRRLLRMRGVCVQGGGGDQGAQPGGDRAGHDHRLRGAPGRTTAGRRRPAPAAQRRGGRRLLPLHCDPCPILHCHPAVFVCLLPRWVRPAPPKGTTHPLVSVSQAIVCRRRVVTSSACQPKPFCSSSVRSECQQCNGGCHSRGCRRNLAQQACRHRCRYSTGMPRSSGWLCL